MSQQDRAVTPVISTILVVAIVVILAATVSVAFLGVTQNLTEPAPIVADTTGEFEAGPGNYTQIVRITHVAGDSIEVENIEIIVRASGPGSKLPVETRIVNLPGGDGSDFCAGKGYPGGRLSQNNIQGERFFVKESCAPNQIITAEDSNTWSPGETIQFQISSNKADFSASTGNNEANKLEVIIVHTPSNAIISEHVFRP